MEDTRVTLLLITAMIMVAVQYYNSCREQHYLTRSGIVDPKLSAWTKLYMHGDANSFLTITGFTRHAFDLLLSILFPPINPDNPKKRGRPSILSNDAKLGLYLCWTNSSMKRKHLSLIFGVVPTTVGEVVTAMRLLFGTRKHTFPIRVSL